MGGKRPDQYQIDPGEAGSTDYKRLPETSRGHSRENDTIGKDHERFSQQQSELHRDASGVPEPGTTQPPSVYTRYGHPLSDEQVEEDLSPESGRAGPHRDRKHPL